MYSKYENSNIDMTESLIIYFASSWNKCGSIGHTLGQLKGERNVESAWYPYHSQALCVHPWRKGWSMACLDCLRDKPTREKTNYSCYALITDLNNHILFWDYAFQTYPLKKV